MNYTELLNSHRRKPLAHPREMPLQFSFEREDIKKILPHREPFFFIDKITALNREKNLIAGEFKAEPSLSVFQGHFPEYPVFPGSLQVEALGQIGLCLAHFIGRKTDEISKTSVPPNVRATRIHGAAYRNEVKPGDSMTLLARLTDYDAYFGVILGQVLVKNQVTTTAILEVAFLE